MIFQTLNMFHIHEKLWTALHAFVLQHNKLATLVDFNFLVTHLLLHPEGIKPESLHCKLKEKHVLAPNSLPFPDDDGRSQTMLLQFYLN